MPNEYAMFVKNNFHKVKKPGQKATDVMKELAQIWRARKKGSKKGGYSWFNRSINPGPFADVRPNPMWEFEMGSGKKKRKGKGILDFFRPDILGRTLVESIAKTVT